MKIPYSVYWNSFLKFKEKELQKVFTSPELLRRILDNWHFNKEDSVLVLYNVEILLYLVKERGLLPQNIYIYTNNLDKKILEKQGYNVVFQEKIDLDKLKTQFGNMKFDYILGNPPYQDTTADRKKFNQLGNKKLWKLFLKKSSHLLKDNGILNFLVPQAVTKSTNFGKPGDAISKMDGVKVLSIETGMETYFQDVSIKICSISFKKTNDSILTIIDGSQQDFNNIGFVTADPKLQSIALKLLKNDNSVRVSRHSEKIYTEEKLSELGGIWSGRFGGGDFSFERDVEQTKEILWQSDNNPALMNLLKSNLFFYVAWDGFVIVDKRWYHNFWKALSLNKKVTENSTLEELMEIYELDEAEKELIRSKPNRNVR